MINEGVFKDYAEYTTSDSFTVFLQEDIDDALNNLYSLQNEIQLNALTVNDEHEELVNGKNVDIVFVDTDGNKKTL